MNGAWKVGLLVIVFGSMLVGAYAVLGQNLWAEKPDLYYAELNDAGGVTPGTRILLSGVKVGTVRKVELASAETAKMTLALDSGTKIPQGTSVKIPSSFIGFGDTPIQLVPGKGPGEVAVGSTLAGKKTTALESVMPEAKDTLAALESTLKETQLMLKDARSLLNDKQLYGNVNKLMATTERTVGQYGKLAGRMDRLIAQNQGKLGDALTMATGAMSDIRKSTQIISKLLEDGKLTDQTTALLENLNQTTEKAGKLIDNLNAFVEDPELRGPLQRTAANVEKITDSGTRMTGDLEKMAKNGVTITENTATLTAKANELADETKTVLQQVQKLLGKAPSPGKIKVEGGLDLVRTERPGYYRTDLEAKIDFSNNRLYAGLYDAFESNKVTLQLGKSLDPKTELRYGIYASKPGLGVEYALARGLYLRGDFYDINNPRADLRARYSLGGGAFGWLGVDQAFKKNRFLVGVGFRK